MSVLREIDLTPWQRFQLWVELDSTQLGMDLATYYAICSLFGLIQAMSFALCVQAIF